MGDDPTDRPTDAAADLEGLLGGIDAALAEQQRRRAEEKAREARALEEEHGRLAGAIAKAEERAAQARALGAREVLAQLEPGLERARARARAILAELGYDPAERRAEEERAAVETFTRESERAAAGLLARVRQLHWPDDARDAARELLLELPILRLADAHKVLGALRLEVQRREWELPDELAGFEEALREFAADEAGEQRFRDWAREQCARHERLEELDKEIAALEQETGLLETGVGRLPPAATRATVHGIACRAKLLQQRHADLITREQNSRMRRSVFGRLHLLVKDTQCGFVPSLQQAWLPASLEAEIGQAERDLRVALDGRPAPVADAESGGPAEELRQARERLASAERWVLAEVYRWSNACFECPDDETARTRLRQAVVHASRFLEERKEELVRVLRHDEALFEQGSEFRWLRRKLARLREEEAAEPGAAELEAAEATARGDGAVDSAGDSAVDGAVGAVDGAVDGAGEVEAAEPAAGGVAEAADEGALETLTGERVLHPSVLRALRHTRNRRVVMVGGAVRAERRDKLAALFEAAEWSWVPSERGDGQRAKQQLAAQVRAGSPDLVVCLLGFLSHAASEIVIKAAREADLPCAIVPRGYGEVAIAHGIVSACGVRAA